MNWKIKTIKSRKIKLICGILFVAERTGFEPAKPFRGLHAFQTFTPRPQITDFQRDASEAVRVCVVFAFFRVC